MFPGKPQAFLAMPVAAPFIEVIHQIKTVLRGKGIEPRLSRDLAGFPIQQIQSAIGGADVVIADVTGKDPNVFFELGMALGLNKPVLLLSQEPAKDLPSDLWAQQVAVYRPADFETVRRYLELWLRDTLSRPASAAY
jgi:hypothetical protein